MRYFTVDAFAQEPFGGNPAGVVLLEKESCFPDDETMRKIAAEMRYSEGKEILMTILYPRMK